jgi:hypothetical protein
MTSPKSGGDEQRRRKNDYKKLWAKTRGAESRRASRMKYYRSPKYEEKRLKYREQHRLYLLSERGQAAKRRGRKQPEPTRPKPTRCECCGLSDLVFKKGLFLDHCHDTGAFRGWLCDNCNLGIGRLGDDLEGVQKAVAYLTKFG